MSAATRDDAFTPVDEIRVGIAVIAALFETGQLDKDNLAEGLGFIAERCAELDGEPAAPGSLTIPLMTLDEVAAEARAQRPVLRIVTGGRP